MKLVLSERSSSVGFQSVDHYSLKPGEQFTQHPGRGGKYQFVIAGRDRDVYLDQRRNIYVEFVYNALGGVWDHFERPVPLAMAEAA